MKTKKKPVTGAPSDVQRLVPIPTIAKELGLTRQAVWRACDEGRLNTTIKFGVVLVVRDKLFASFKPRYRTEEKKPAKKKKAVKK